MNRLKTYLQHQFVLFDNKSFLDRNMMIQGIIIFLCWVIPSFTFVWIINHFHQYVPHIYLEAAIAEGIGPHLWNVLGTFALMLFGLSILFPKSKLLIKSSYQILTNTFSIGGLMFGLLFGQLFTKIVSVSQTLSNWKIWLFSTGFTILAIQAFLLNFAFWWIASLTVERENNNAYKVFEQLTMPIRLALFVLFSILPTYLLFLEK